MGLRNPRCSNFERYINARAPTDWCWHYAPPSDHVAPHSRLLLCAPPTRSPVTSVTLPQPVHRQHPHWIVRAKLLSADLLLRHVPLARPFVGVDQVGVAVRHAHVGALWQILLAYKPAVDALWPMIVTQHVAAPSVHPKRPIMVPTRSLVVHLLRSDPRIVRQ